MHQPPGARILVVDDNPDNRDMLARRVRRIGPHRIDMAEDGLDALAQIGAALEAGDGHDVVMLDVMMPRMNGVEVLEAVTARGWAQKVSIIMISAATEIETVVRCIELGAEDYLPKPFNPVLLRARLNAVLEKKHLRDALDRQLERLENELAEARRQQLSMVPDEFPVAGPGQPFAVHAVMHPAREVGGDFYDCFACGPDLTCLAIGDVSDKGVPAALFMARTRSLLRAAALHHADLTGAAPTPSDLAAILNEELCKNNPAGMFVTLILGFLDGASGRFAFVNAGHPRPFLLRAGAPAQEVATRPAPPLGIAPGLRYVDHTVVLEPSTCLVAITDGLTDMLDAQGEEYGAARVVRDLEEATDLDPAAITRMLAAKVRDFAADVAPADDVTVLAVRYG